LPQGLWPTVAPDAIPNTPKAVSVVHALTGGAIGGSFVTVPGSVKDNQFRGAEELGQFFDRDAGIDGHSGFGRIGVT
jgi:hypothetical protein